MIPKEVAIKEVKDFVERYDDTLKEDYEIEKDYPQVLKAVQGGFLSFDENSVPVYKLKYPIKSDSGEVVLETINFKTRVKPDDLANISKGLNVSTQQFEFTLRCLAYIIQQPKAILNKLEKFDYKVIEQISTVFL